MRTRCLLPILAVLLLCCHWIGAKISEPVQPTMTAATTTATAPPLPPLEPVATSFAKFEAANAIVAASSVPVNTFNCGPDPRKCVGTMTIPIGCRTDVAAATCAADLAHAEGTVLHLKRPDWAGFAGDCTIHNLKCVIDIDTPRASYNAQSITFTFTDDVGGLKGAFELFTVGVQ